VLTTYAHVDLSALIHNLTHIRRHLAPDCDILAIVKANAYGHGAVEVSQTLVKHGVSRLAVASMAEGIALREAGITADMVVLGVPFNEHIPDLFRYRLTPVVSDRRVLLELARMAAGQPSPFSIHLKVDTGMGRLGFAPGDIASIIGEALQQPSLRIEGLMTHLADADGETIDATEAQLKKFDAVLGLLQANGLHVPLIHAANSAALIRFPRARFSLVRPGIMLYGYHTLPDSVVCPTLKPVLSLHTVISHLRIIEPGESVSYNRTFIATRPTKVAVLPIGYADGYSRRLSNRGTVLIRERQAPIIGLVCMDMTMVDVTDLPEVHIGDPVTLIGQQGSETLWADRLADWTGTIPYEVLCAIGSRVPRIYRAA